MGQANLVRKVLTALGRTVKNEVCLLFFSLHTHMKLIDSGVEDTARHLIPSGENLSQDIQVMM